MNTKKMSDIQPALPAPQDDENAFQWNLRLKPKFATDGLPVSFVRSRMPRDNTYTPPFGMDYEKLGDMENHEYALPYIVSSKNARDIVRSGNFMPGQFDIWNKNEKGGNGKYQGKYVDIDGDKIPEFVVTRDGKTVAVNGYTTRKSDFPFRAEFYKGVPNPKDRSDLAKQGITMNKWLTQHYYNPVYSPDGSEILEWKGENPTTARFKEKYAKYKTHRPYALSSYQAFAQFLVKPAVKAAFENIANNIPEKVKVARKVAGKLAEKTLGWKAFDLQLTAYLYYLAVKKPFIEQCPREKLAAYQKEFVEYKQRKIPEFQVNWNDPQLETRPEYKEFLDWLFKKKEPKEVVKAGLNNTLSNQNARDNTVENFKDRIIAFIKSTPGFDQELDAEWDATLQNLDQQYSFGYAQE